MKHALADQPAAAVAGNLSVPNKSAHQSRRPTLLPQVIPNPPLWLRMPGLATTATFMAVLLLWEGLVHVFTIPSFLLPAPTAILESFGAVGPARWATHIWATLRVAIMGFGLAICVAIPLAMVMMRSPFLSKTLYSLLGGVFI